MARVWYVYALNDPRDGSTFYIGKGTGRRAWEHERLAQRGDTSNPTKVNRILEILAAGLAVGVEILAEFDDEASALAHERFLIESTAGLLNCTYAGGSDWASRLHARLVRVERIYEQWLAGNPDFVDPPHVLRHLEGDTTIGIMRRALEGVRRLQALVLAVDASLTGAH